MYLEKGGKEDGKKCQKKEKGTVETNLHNNFFHQNLRKSGVVGWPEAHSPGRLQAKLRRSSMPGGIYFPAGTVCFGLV